MQRQMAPLLKNPPPNSTIQVPLEAIVSSHQPAAQLHLLHKAALRRFISPVNVSWLANRPTMSAHLNVLPWPIKQPTKAQETAEAPRQHTSACQQLDGLRIREKDIKAQYT